MYMYMYVYVYIYYIYIYYVYIIYIIYIIYIGKRETKKKQQICSDSEFHVIQFSNCFHI